MAASLPSRRCTIIPDSILQQIARDPTQNDAVLHVVRQTLAQGSNLSATYNSSIVGSVAEQMKLHQLPGGFTTYIFDAQHKEEFPGHPTIYAEGANLKHYSGGELTYEQGITPKYHQTAILCNQLRHIARFFHDTYNFALLDGTSAVITASLNYGQEYSNCFWDHAAKHMVIGDPTCFILGNFIQATDVLAHELTHGIISATSDLKYEGQAGALNEHLADVFGALCNQRQNERMLGTHREAATLGADWDIGAHWFHLPAPSAPSSSTNQPTISNNGNQSDSYKCLRSFSDPESGAMWQPKHSAQFANLPIDEANDWGGVHTNSGIPNHAFYVAACKAGGQPWEGVGRIWFATMVDTRLGPDCDFARFAAFTIYHARVLAPELESAIAVGWAAVGVSCGP